MVITSLSFINFYHFLTFDFVSAVSFIEYSRFYGPLDGSDADFVIFITLSGSWRDGSHLHAKELGVILLLGVVKVFGVSL